jgi:hypothetical protein
MVDANPMRKNAASVIDLARGVTSPNVPLGDGSNMSDKTIAGEIRVLEDLPPDQLRRGDYVQRGPYRSLKVTTIRRLGAVWRIAGMSSDVGPNTIYPLVEARLRVVRGFPASSLPEKDAPRLAPFLPALYGEPAPSGEQGGEPA